MKYIYTYYQLNSNSWTFKAYLLVEQCILLTDGFPKLVLSLLNMAYELVLALYYDIKIALYLYLNC